MSGHSKWSQIKRQKGAADIKRSANFTKLTHAIIVAAKSGGDPAHNFTLKMAIEKAKEGNMPKENIERAIKRGTGEIAGTKVEEVLYEALAPGGVGIIIEALTDNRNRTNSEIKNAITRFGGKLVSAGAITYQFRRVGKLALEITNQKPEDIELKAIDAGAIDIQEEDSKLIIMTKPNELEVVKKALEKGDIKVLESTLSWEPLSLVTISDLDQGQKIISLLETLDNLGDVSTIYANIELQNQ